MFLKANLNCNLWSRKSVSIGAQLLGWSHSQLIETILCEALRRSGLLETRALGERPSALQELAAAI